MLVTPSEIVTLVITVRIASGGTVTPSYTNDWLVATLIYIIL